MILLYITLICANEVYKSIFLDLKFINPLITCFQWEPKPKRMLMMQLTDGVTEVKGMEYKHIPALNASLPAGVKVRLTSILYPDLLHPFLQILEKS